MGQEYFPFQIQQFNLIHYFVGIINGLRKVFKNLRHLCTCFQIELVVGKCKAFIFDQHIVISKFTQGWCTLFFSGIDAEQDIMCIKIVLVYIMRIVAGYNFYIVLFGKLQ